MPDFKILSRSSGFSVMNNDIFHDLELSHSAMGLLCKMLSLPPEWDYSIRGLVAISKDGRDAITKQLKELEMLGYITRTQSRNSSGKMGKMTYIVRDFKENVSNFQVLNDEKSKTESCSDFSEPEEPHQRETPQQNTDSVSNENEKFIVKYKAIFGRSPDKSLLRIVGQAVPEDVETALSIAAKKKIDNPAAYLTTILTKMQQKRQDEATKPDVAPENDVQAPLEDWEIRWLTEVKKRIAEREKTERDKEA